jgi:hypothetical protein
LLNRGRKRSGTPGSAFITLKNLQKKRICHVPMLLAKAIGGVLYHNRFPAGTLQRDRWRDRHFCVMERALKHKFSVGETVYFTASNVARPAASGTYEVIRLLPTDGDDCQYRIKSSIEAFERVAKESQLAVS